MSKLPLSVRMMFAGLILSLGAVVGAMLGAEAGAEEAKVQHYAAKPSATLAEAVSNLAAYNALMADILDQSKLSPGDMERIHELTYTLEQALARIEAELGPMAADLEALHLASEDGAQDAIRTHGAAYLGAARTLLAGGTD